MIIFISLNFIRIWQILWNGEWRWSHWLIQCSYGFGIVFLFSPSHNPWQPPFFSYFLILWDQSIPIPCNGDHTVYTSLSLTYFTSHNALSLHPQCCKYQDFLLFYGGIIHCIYHYFLILFSPTDSGVISMAIVNNAAENLRVQISLWHADLISFMYKHRCRVAGT